MREIHTITELRDALAKERAAGKSVGFVPTMGALHDGHLALIAKAREDCDLVVVSIFVNPAQFDRKTDLASYPRDPESDSRIATDNGVNLLFCPSVEEMYPDHYYTYVFVEDLSAVLCGSVRPGHFRGVTTVVAKLLNIVRPDIAYFGEKDYQQLVIVKRMVQDLNMDADIVGVPTVRDPDGLAISSRNTLLNATEREDATVIPRALFMARDMAGRRGVAASRIMERARMAIGEEPRVRIEYLNVVDPRTLRDVRQVDDKALVALAAYVGEVRLIDNIMVGPGA
ncbi:MAG: pantoate--beta-alanine ligase [Actinobacteria bacterium]|nr:MAG: pantoate--beta-alanine ligase [Actinomycetota bacterium]